jgi:hypothetical protein
MDPMTAGPDSNSEDENDSGGDSNGEEHDESPGTGLQGGQGEEAGGLVAIRGECTPLKSGPEVLEGQHSSGLMVGHQR